MSDARHGRPRASWGAVEEVVSAREEVPWRPKINSPKEP